MKVKSKQFVVAILVGAIIGALISVFTNSGGWATIISVTLAAYLAKVSSPKEGAIVGSITIIPIGIYAIALANIQTKALETRGILATIPFLLLGFLIIIGIGALFGLIIGKIFQLTKSRKWMM